MTGIRLVKNLLVLQTIIHLTGVSHHKELLSTSQNETSYILKTMGVGVRKIRDMLKNFQLVLID